MDQHDLESIDSKIDKCFSVVEFNLNNHTIQFASNFAMEYYVRKIQQSDKYKVAHMTSFLYDTDRLRYIVDHMPLVSPTLQDRLSQNVLVWQCLSLAQMHDFVNEMLLSLSGASRSGGSFELVVIEDLDEAFNIASFENYILAGKTIVSIMRTIRKISQTYDVTFILAQRKARMNFNVKHVARMVRSMLDTQVLINGPRILVDCVYDNV